MSRFGPSRRRGRLKVLVGFGELQKCEGASGRPLASWMTHNGNSAACKYLALRMERGWILNDNQCAPGASGSRFISVSTTQTSSRLYAALPLSHGEPNLISTRGQPLIRRKGPLEVIIFHARDKAEIFEGRKQLLCFGGLAKQ